MNGFGVMMARNDPMEEAWVSAASLLDESCCALEIGAAFGRATVEALQRGCPHVVCNDLSSSHLMEVKRRSASIPAGTGRLTTLMGSAPTVLDGWVPLKPIRAVLAANVIHFLSPDEVSTLFSRLHELCADDAELFVSVDAPWNGGYRPLWPLYAARRFFGDPHPGHTRFPGPLSYVLPERLRAVRTYHPMEPRELARLLEASGWHVVHARHFKADADNNPEGVSISSGQFGSGIEMTGAHAAKHPAHKCGMIRQRTVTPTTRSPKRE